jgi:hypothetical protein
MVGIDKSLPKIEAQEHMCKLLRLVQWATSPLAYIDCATSTFSLPLDYSAPAASCTNLQHLAHNHINISHIILLSLSQHHHFIINYVDIEFEKTNWISIENTLHNN